MTKPVMKYGARKGRMSTMRRWIAGATSNDVRIFPVPGADLLRLYQAETEMDALLAANPREANVLLVAGELTESLAQKAGVAYQQIPRPRVLVLAGPKQAPPLPDPDVHVSLNDGFLAKALPQVRQLLKDYAWSEEAEPWEPDFLTEMLEDQENGGGHDHGGMDFMSMVAMTKDLPRPKDGLPMNRSEVHFGPFHPGLPGGLSVLMALDGDTVIEANVEGDLAARSLNDLLPLEAEALPDMLARLNPLTPETYRLLAHKALSDAGVGENAFSSTEIVLLETERIVSHLNWLATFAKAVGSDWMHLEAARWHALHRKEEASAEKLVVFLGQIRSMPYLKTKLSVGRAIPHALLHHLSGPASKAAGKTEDTRSDDEMYQSLGWASVLRQGNSAWGRLLVRLEEIEQSLELIKKAEKQKPDTHNLDYSGSGEGMAKLESPRGTVSLHISIDDGRVQELHLETPSKPLAALVPSLTEEAELSDALVQIASLDIAPREIERKETGVHQ